jgi:hypothetical protein
LSFRGGEGFTEVHRHRIEWRPSWYRGESTCASEGGELSPRPGEILEASGHRPGSSATQGFWMYQPKPGARVEYSAAETELRGPIEIERSAWAYGRSRTLTFTPDFSTAAVEPPAPFSGSASFRRTDRARGTWLGDLTVDFPDLAGVRLAGDDFEARFHSGLLEGEAR